MFSKNQELERLTEPVDEEIGELSDEQLVSVVGGLESFVPTASTEECPMCGAPQPTGWTADTCYYCGFYLSDGPKPPTRP